MAHGTQHVVRLFESEKANVVSIWHAFGTDRQRNSHQGKNMHNAGCHYFLRSVDEDEILVREWLTYRHTFDHITSSLFQPMGDISKGKNAREFFFCIKRACFHL